MLPRATAYITLVALLALGHVAGAEKITATSTVEYEATSVLAGADGAVYVGGVTVPEGVTRGAAAVSKLSSSGQEMWRKILTDLQYPGEDHNNLVVKEIARDPFGNLVVLATTTCYAGFHSGFTIARFDPDGTLQWAKYHDVSGYAFTTAYGISVDVDGDVYVAVFMLNVKEGPAPVAAIVRYDSQGEHFTTLTLPGSLHYGLRETDATITLDLAVDSAKNIYVGGSGGVVKFDPTGNQIWSTLPDTPPYSNNWSGVAIALDRSDNVLLTGSGGTIKYSAAGTLLWRNETATGKALAVDGGGNVFVTGSGGTKKLDPLGTVIWQTELPAVAISVLPTGNFYLLNGKTVSAYGAN